MSKQQESSGESEKLLFKVISDGKEYRIYTDGRVEGFGACTMIFNYFLAQVHRRTCGCESLLNHVNDAALQVLEDEVTATSPRR